MLVDRFKNGNPQNDKPLNRPDVNPKVDYWGGDLAGLQQKIDDGYFETLGVNTLWISPLNQNPTQPYGYYAPMKTKFQAITAIGRFLPLKLISVSVRTKNLRI